MTDYSSRENNPPLGIGGWEEGKASLSGLKATITSVCLSSPFLRWFIAVVPSLVLRAETDNTFECECVEGFARISERTTKTNGR